MKIILENLYLNTTEFSNFIPYVLALTLIAVISYALLRRSWRSGGKWLRVFYLSIVISSICGVGFLFLGLRHGDDLRTEILSRRSSESRLREWFGIATTWRRQLEAISPGTIFPSGLLEKVYELRVRVQNEFFLVTGSSTHTIPDNLRPIGLIRVARSKLDLSLSRKLENQGLGGYARGLGLNSKGNIFLGGTFWRESVEICAIETSPSGEIIRALPLSAFLQSSCPSELNVLPDDSLLLIGSNSSGEYNITHLDRDFQNLRTTQIDFDAQIKPSRQPTSGQFLRHFLTENSLLFYSGEKMGFLSFGDLQTRSVILKDTIPKFQPLKFVDVWCEDYICRSDPVGSDLLALVPQENGRILFIIQQYSAGKNELSGETWLRIGWLAKDGKFELEAAPVLAACEDSKVSFADSSQSGENYFSGVLSLVDPTGVPGKRNPGKKCRNLVVWKVRNDGSIDLSFAHNATTAVQKKLGNSAATAGRIKILPDQQIIVIGTAPAASSTDSAKTGFLILDDSGNEVSTKNPGRSSISP